MARQVGALRDFAAALEAQLVERYGPVLTGSALTTALGYPSQEAFRQALHRDRVPVRVFSIAGRRGKFALSLEVARWLAEQRMKAAAPAERVTMA